MVKNKRHSGASGGSVRALVCNEGASYGPLPNNVIYNGAPSSSLSALVNSGFDPAVLRPWIDRNGGFYMNSTDAFGKVSAVPTSNAVLRKDEWIEMDRVLVETARRRLRAVGDLLSRGLETTLNGMAKTVLEFERVSDMGPAVKSMDGLTRSENERLTFDLDSLPLPITHKDFEINTRFLNVSRNSGSGMDVLQQAVAAIKVTEDIENTLINGYGTFQYAGAHIYGYTNFPGRNTGTLRAPWTDSGTTGTMIVADARDMRQAQLDNRQFGDSILYVCPSYETKLDDDFKAESDVTIRERLLKLNGIIAVEVSDFLADGNVLLVQMESTTVRMVIGMPLTNVQWETQGGFVMKFKVMSIMVPQIRADIEGNCGITHFTEP